jgi:hypothetical protein
MTPLADFLAASGQSNPLIFNIGSYPAAVPIRKALLVGRAGRGAWAPATPTGAPWRALLNEKTELRTDRLGGVDGTSSLCLQPATFAAINVALAAELATILRFDSFDHSQRDFFGGWVVQAVP